MYRASIGTCSAVSDEAAYFKWTCLSVCYRRCCVLYLYHGYRYKGIFWRNECKLPPELPELKDVDDRLQEPDAEGTGGCLVAFARVVGPGV